MKEKIRLAVSVVCFAVAALSVLFFLFTIFEGGWLFLVIGAPFLLAGLFLLRKEISADPVETRLAASNKRTGTKKAQKQGGEEEYDPPVLLTVQGKKFHMDPLCPSIRNAETIRMARSKALAAGYEPCEKCSWDLM